MHNFLCQVCSNNLRNYYQTYYNKIYGKYHNDIVTELLYWNCVYNDGRTDGCKFKIYEFDKFLECISKIYSLNQKDWSLIDGLAALSEMTYNINVDRDQKKIIKNPRHLIYHIVKNKIPKVNFFDENLRYRQTDNIEHILPQSFNQCQTSLSSIEHFSNCLHISDPFNMLQMDPKTNNARQIYPYASNTYCHYGVQNSLIISNLSGYQTSRLHKCKTTTDNNFVIEPLHNIGKFMIGSRLLYNYIVYGTTLSDTEINDIIQWTTNHHLQPDEIDKIVSYNQQLSDIFGVDYSFFNPNEINKLFNNQQHVQPERQLEISFTKTFYPVSLLVNQLNLLLDSKNVSIIEIIKSFEEFYNKQHIPNRFSSLLEQIDKKTINEHDIKKHIITSILSLTSTAIPKSVKKENIKINIVRPQQTGGYFEKYIKYKTKYLMLKKNLVA
jgi:hypothetical protein